MEGDGVAVGSGLRARPVRALALAMLVAAPSLAALPVQPAAAEVVVPEPPALVFPVPQPWSPPNPVHIPPPVPTAGDMTNGAAVEAPPQPIRDPDLDVSAPQLPSQEGWSEDQHWYPNPDGSLRLELFSRPRYFRDAAGAWREIDLAPLPQGDGSVVARASGRPVRLPATADQPVEVETAAGVFSIAHPGAGAGTVGITV